MVSVLQWFHSRALSASAETRHTAVTQWIDRYGSRIVSSTRTSLNSLTNGSYDTLMADCPTCLSYPEIPWLPRGIPGKNRGGKQGQLRHCSLLTTILRQRTTKDEGGKETVLNMSQIEDI
ncbi:MAG: hypothetical protein WCY01_13970, partial [Alkalispirochaeta sp.]